MPSRSSSIACGALSALALQLCIPAAHADSATDGNAWRIQVTPYVWLPSLKGSMQARNIPNTQISQSFSDTWSDLNAAAFLSGTARKGSLVMQADASYASISENASVPYGPYSLKGSASVKQTSFTLTGGYGWDINPQNNLDLMVGFRWWHLKGTLDAGALGSSHLDQSFADPIIAARWRHDFNDKWSSVLYADYGKYSGGSQSTYQWLAVLNYQVKEQIFVSAGYRVLDVDYQKGAKQLDVRLRGPILGVTFKF